MTTRATVEPATIQDVPAIRRVAEWSWQAAYEDLLGESVIDDLVGEWYASERLRSHITDPESVFLVARRGGRVRGYIDVESNDTRDVYFLSRLYVEPSLWGAGIGTQLLEAALNDLGADRDRLELTVLSDNDRAIGFYEHHGFEFVASRTTTLGPIEVEEAVYSKPLSEPHRQQG